MIYYVIVVFVILISVLIWITVHIKRTTNLKQSAECRNLVKSSSLRYKYLLQKYEKYGIAHIISNVRTYVLRCNSPQQYKNIDIEHQTILYLHSSNLYDDFLSVESCLHGYDYDLSQAPEYLSKTELSELLVPGKIDFERYRKTEIDLMSQFEIDCSRIPVFTFYVEYVSPAGRKFLRNSRTYVIDDIMWMYGLDVSSEQKNTNENKKRTVSAGQRQRILRRDGFTCRLCGAKGPGAGGNAVLHVDHRIPFSRGGADDDSNLWTLCQSCNLGKGNRYTD